MEQKRKPWKINGEKMGKRRHIGEPHSYHRKYFTNGEELIKLLESLSGQDCK